MQKCESIHTFYAVFFGKVWQKVKKHKNSLWADVLRCRNFVIGAGFDVEAFDLFDEGRALHVEELGGLHFVAAGLVEGLEQQLALDLRDDL